MYTTLVSEETATASLMKLKIFGLEMEKLCVFCHVGLSVRSLSYEKFIESTKGTSLEGAI